jgi:hypothetical protein
MALPNRMSLRPGLLWLIINQALIIQCLSRNNIYIFFNFTYPLKYVRVILLGVFAYSARGEGGVRVTQVEDQSYIRMMQLQFASCWIVYTELFQQNVML